MAGLLVLLRPAEILQNGADVSRKNFIRMDLRKRRESPQCHKVASWPGCQRCLCHKEQEHSHQSRSPDRKVGESQGEHKRTLVRNKEGQSGSMMRKGWTPPWRKAGSKEERRASMENLASKSCRKHEWVSGRKSSPGKPGKSWFHFQVWSTLK